MNKRAKLDDDDREKKRKRHISGDGLSLHYYSQFLSKRAADELMQKLEECVEYYEGDLTKVKVFGKWHQIPRQQVAYGDEGIEYRFSGVTVPSKPWIESLKSVKDYIQSVTGFEYNFVLVNRYRNGKDHIGEHRDGEAELDKTAPIASLSLGQERTFVLRHKNARKRKDAESSINITTPIRIELEHGSLLMMNPPTNEYWYHSLPVRRNVNGIRINLTFRRIIIVH